MSLNSSKALPTANVSGFTSYLPTIGILNNDLALYHLQGITTDKQPKPANAFGIIAVRKGVLHVEINNQSFLLSKDAVAYIPPNASFSIKSNDSLLEGYMMVLSDLFVRSLQVPVEVSHDRSFVSYYKQEFSDDIKSSINKTFVLIKDELSDNKRFFRREKLLNLISIFYIDILNAYAKNTSVQQMLCCTRETSRKEKLSKDFFRLVKQYSREQRQVIFYADKLCITPKYLSSLIKQTTGKSANEWITNAVIIEAKRLLQTSGNSIKEIAFSLNFANQSFFGKYFKNMVGVSPKDYQRNLEFNFS